MFAVKRKDLEPKNRLRRRLPSRDCYDWLMLCIQGIGIIFIALTIAITLKTNADNNRDMAVALKEMNRMARSMSNQQQSSFELARASEELAEKTGLMAQAAKDQANAAVVQADAALRYAEAAQNQAETASSELSLRREPAVDIVLNFVTEADGDIVPAANVINSGSPIRSAEYCHFAAFIRNLDFDTLWRDEPDCIIIDLIPGVGDRRGFKHPPLSSEQWAALPTENLWIAEGVRLRFRDAAGRQQEIRRCVAYRRPLVWHYCPRI